MRILFVDTTNDSERIGGGHLYLPGLMGRLIERQHDVHLVTKGEPDEAIRDQINDSGASVHIRPWKRAGIVEDNSVVFAKWVNDLSPDIYLISGSYDIGWVSLPLLDPKIATLMTAHNDSETFYRPLKHYGRFLTRAVGVSEEICREFVDRCGIVAERVIWIPYGINASADRPNRVGNGPLRMVYVGRVEDEQKRFSDLVGVVKALSAAGVDFLFQVVGDGVSMPVVERELAGEIVSGKVVLHGWLDSEKVIDIVRDSEVFVLASAFEGFCIALIEAMANGCAPIVTDIKSGNKHLVRDGENGFVRPIGDIEGFAEKIEYLAKNRDVLLEFRQKAWETGNEYSVGRMVDSYEAGFQEAMEDAKAHPRTLDPDFPLMESCRSKYPLWLRRIKAQLVNS